MNFSISKQTFQHIIDTPFCLSFNGLNFKYRTTKDCCLGFVLPKALGMANQRNQFKRRCRNLAQNLFNNQKIPNMGLIVTPKNLNVSYNDLVICFDGLLDNILENMK